jgi:hypothetical protein
MRKEKGQAKQQEQQSTQNTLSQVLNGIELIWGPKEDSNLFDVSCSGVFCFCIE